MSVITEQPTAPVSRVAAPESALDILLLSSSLLTDRMFLYTNCLPTLAQNASVRLWATSARNPRFQHRLPTTEVQLEEFPEIRPFKEFPYNYLRRLNEFVWDFRHKPPSRMSMFKHMRSKDEPWLHIVRSAAWPLSWFPVEQRLESWLEGLLVSYPRSPKAEEKFRAKRPDAVVCTGPYRFDEPAVVGAARKHGIPTLALITSWDNLSTKNRLVFNFGGYLLWSEQMKRDLFHFYPQTRNLPVYVVGAPQFDVFFQERFQRPREEFLRAQKLDPNKKVILFALGSPNCLQEHHAAIYLAKALLEDRLGDAQLLVRPHPLFANGEETKLLRGFGPRVVVQETGQEGLPLNARSQDADQIADWVNTFRHADVVVNLSSTAAIDAAIFDVPVVNIDFDPEPGQPNQGYVKDVNHLWTHFKPIAESGGIWLVNDCAEMVEATNGYLKNPALHKEKRRWIAEYVCGYVDGRCGERMADAILDFTRVHASRNGK